MPASRKECLQDRGGKEADFLNEWQVAAEGIVRELGEGGPDHSELCGQVKTPGFILRAGVAVEMFSAGQLHNQKYVCQGSHFFFFFFLPNSSFSKSRNHVFHFRHCILNYLALCLVLHKCLEKEVGNEWMDEYITNVSILMYIPFPHTGTQSPVCFTPYFITSFFTGIDNKYFCGWP